MGKSLKIGTLIPVNLLNDLSGSSSLINLDFLLLHTAHFDKSIIILFLVFTIFGCLLSVFFPHLDFFYNKITLFYR